MRIALHIQQLNDGVFKFGFGEFLSVAHFRWSLRWSCACYLVFWLGFHGHFGGCRSGRYDRRCAGVAVVIQIRCRRRCRRYCWFRRGFIGFLACFAAVFAVVVSVVRTDIIAGLSGSINYLIPANTLGIQQSDFSEPPQVVTRRSIPDTQRPHIVG